jgi:hypothetical protein
VEYACLTGLLEYIALPSWVRGPAEFSSMSPAPCGLRLFVGQTTYDTTPRTLRYIVYAVSRVHLVFVDTMRRQPSACFYAYCATEADRSAVVAAMNKRVLFDVGGVWVARTPAEEQLLNDFLLYIRTAYVPTTPLPRTSMVVELPQLSPNKRRL